MAENKIENEDKSTSKGSETKQPEIDPQPEINLGAELNKLIETYNSRLDATCADIDQDLTELAEKKIPAEFSPEDKKQLDNLHAQKEEVGKQKLNLSDEKVGEVVNYFVETVFPARKDEMRKITVSFLGRVAKSLKTENPEAIVAALENLPGLYHTLPVKDIEKWAGPVESYGYSWPDQGIVDYYSLKTSVPVRKSGRPVLTALVAGLIGLAAGAGVIGALSYENVWNPTAQEAQLMNADCQSKNKSLTEQKESLYSKLVESKDDAKSCHQNYETQSNNLNACSQEKENYLGINAGLDSKNKTLTEKLKSEEEALQSANDNYNSCSKQLEESQAKSSDLSDKLNACEAAKTDLETKVVMTPEERGYTLQNIADFLGSQPDKYFMVENAPDVRAALTGLYLGMGGDISNQKVLDTFVKEFGYLYKSDNPYSNTVIFSEINQN